MRSMLLLLLILGFLGAATSDDHDCSWAVDLVEKADMQQRAETLLPGGKYFLRIRVQCGGKINSELIRSLVLTGVTPWVRTESKYLDVDPHHSTGTVHQLAAALVNTANHSCGCEKLHPAVLYPGTTADWNERCLCGHSRPTCFHPRAPTPDSAGECCLGSADCTAGSSTLCSPVWLAPLPFTPHTLGINIRIIDTGVGQYIQPTEYNFHVDGFHVVKDGKSMNALGQEVSNLIPISTPAPLNCQPSLSPVCIHGGPHMADFLLFSSSEFAAIKVLKVPELDTDSSVCQGQSQMFGEIKGTLSLPDRVLMNTPAGVYEVRADFEGNPQYTGSRVRVLPRCVTGLVGPAQSHVRSVVVLALGDGPDKGTAFYATVVRGKPLNFTELRDADDRNACRFLNIRLQNPDTWLCHVVAGSVSGTSLVILAHAQHEGEARFHLLQFQAQSSAASAGEWTALFHLPPSLDASAADAAPGGVMLQSSAVGGSGFRRSLTLSGLSFGAAVTESLFLWGNALLYSPDGGASVHWLTGYGGESEITVFTSSALRGTFAFLTELRELWIGVTGFPTVQRLHESAGAWPLTQSLAAPGRDAHVISVFFDSQGNLQQLVTQNSSTASTDCVFRAQVPAADIVARKTFLAKRNENLQAALAASNNSCASQSLRPRSLAERTCPFAEISFQVPQHLGGHRKCEYRFEPSVFLDRRLVQTKSTALDYFERVQQSANQECDGGTQSRLADAQASKLPRDVILGRREKYQLSVYLFLDLDYFVATSWHSWLRGDLQLSVLASDSSLLKVEVERTDLVQLKAVEYQIVVRDAGKQLPQHPPGQGLTPVSLHMQVSNSGLSCTARSANGEIFEGSHVVTFLVGCPAGRRVAFDSQASKSASGKSHLCTDEAGAPCFLFERTFYPVFMLLDLVSGQSSQFTGNYTLKVVGGGVDLSSLKDYTQEEQELYNYRTSGVSASLVWAAKAKSLGTRPVFNSSTNAISWLCGSRSACGGITPKFPRNAEFYLKLEFSNRDVGAQESNCEYTVRFVIRVHGLPPGSLHPSSIIVLSCLGILATVILCLFALKRKDARLLKLFKGLGSSACGHVSSKVDAARVRVRRWQNRETGTGDIDMTQIRTTPPAAWDASSENQQQIVDPLATGSAATPAHT